MHQTNRLHTLSLECRYTQWFNLFGTIKRIQPCRSESLWTFHHILGTLLELGWWDWEGREGHLVLCKVIPNIYPDVHILYVGWWLEYLWCLGTLEGWVTPSRSLWYLHPCASISLLSVLCRRLTSCLIPCPAWIIGGWVRSITPLTTPFLGGASVLIHGSLDYQELDCLVDEEGRYIILYCRLFSLKCALAFV